MYYFIDLTSLRVRKVREHNSGDVLTAKSWAYFSEWQNFKNVKVLMNFWPWPTEMHNIQWPWLMVSKTEGTTKFGKKNYTTIQ